MNEEKNKTINKRISKYTDKIKHKTPNSSSPLSIPSQPHIPPPRPPSPPPAVPHDGHVVRARPERRGRAGGEPEGRLLRDAAPLRCPEGDPGDEEGGEGGALITLGPWGRSRLIRVFFFFLFFFFFFFCFWFCFVRNML